MICPESFYHQYENSYRIRIFESLSAFFLIASVLLLFNEILSFMEFFNWAGDRIGNGITIAQMNAELLFKRFGLGSKPGYDNIL